MIYNIGSSIIPSGSNLLLDLPIYVDSSIPVGDYNFEISNITLSDASNSDVSSESVEVGVITVTDEVLDILTQQLNEINAYPNPFHSYYIINNPIPIEVLVKEDLKILSTMIFLRDFLVKHLTEDKEKEKER